MTTSNAFDLSAQNEPSYAVATELHDLCADEYIALTASAWDAAPLNVQSQPFGVRAKCWHVGPCMLTEFEMAPFVFEIQRPHLQNRGDMVTMKKHKSGFEFGDYRIGDYYLGPGAIQVGDPLWTGRSISSALEIQEIYLPQALLGLSTSRLAQRDRIYGSHQFGEIAHAEWDSLYSLLKKGRKSISRRTLDLFLASIKIALGVHPQREDIRKQSRELLFRHIERFILSNLRSEGLNSAAILEEFGVSRASLYRLFGPLGGVSSYISKLRASKALIDIWQNKALRGSVRAAQERWGFQSGNDFNRTVTRLFGNSPKRLLDSGRLNNPRMRAASDFAFNFVDMRFAAENTEQAA